MSVISYRQGLNQALAHEMRRDEGVFVYGIDVADHKRTFGSHQGLVEEFGPDRIFSTPLCEDAMTGFGLGAALNGLRPVHVHMRVDFMILAMNQIANMLASYTYGACGRIKVPMVIRAIIGRGWGQSWQHSKTLHSWFAHLPGVRVILPSRPEDARGMLIAAIRDDNPVICIEHRWLYDVTGQAEDEISPRPLDGCRVVREGTDASVLAATWMTVEALKAAEVLSAKHGVSLEVMDLRSAAPFDVATAAESASKTGRLIVADYDWLHCGFSAEAAASVYEAAWSDLKSPVVRLGFKNAHCPCTRPLENEYYANAVDIIRSVERLLDLPAADLRDEEFYSYEKKFKGPF
ncbi:MAG: transketolase C-terminal domain-containing protein [Pseudomonadota bacterium]